MAQPVSAPPSIPTGDLAAQLLALGERFGIRNIRVFGSVARREATPVSDIDLLVDYVVSLDLPSCVSAVRRSNSLGVMWMWPPSRACTR